MKQIIRKRLKNLQPREEKTTGFLGHPDGTVRIPGKLHWVYVRLWNGELIEAFNNGNVPAAFGLAVEVVYRGGRYYIASRDAYDQPVFVGLPDGTEDELQWPGSHTLYVRPEQFLPGLVFPKAGMTVYIYGGRLPLSGGGYISIPSQEIDLTPYRPAANAHWATIGWMSSGTISIVTGGAANSLGELKEAEIPPTGGYDLAAIKLFNGQSSISHGKFGSVIVDLRFFKPGTSTAITWGNITGTLSNQTDLNDALNAKASATDLNNHINNATDAHDASAISIVDAGNYYTGTNVESALAEIGILVNQSIYGWIDDTNTWSFYSATPPIFVASVNADVTSKIGVGDKIRLVQDATTKYFRVHGIQYSGGATLITLYGGTSYTLTNTTISSPAFSHAYHPSGFPLNPDIWSVVVTNTTTYTKTAPTSNVWYGQTNPMDSGSLLPSIVVPTGTWKITGRAIARVANSAPPPTYARVEICLSTSGTSASDPDLITIGSLNADNIQGVLVNTQTLLIFPKIITVTSNTPYYLLVRTPLGSADSLQIQGASGTTVLKATTVL